MVKQAALIFGVVLLAVGILGFVPGITTDGRLLGIFEVDTMHNLIHIATGLAAIGAWVAGGRAPKVFFQVFAVIYGLVTVIGLIQGDTVLGLIPVNVADNLLHVAITAFAAYMGFVAPHQPVTTDAERLVS